MPYSKCIILLLLLANAAFAQDKSGESGDFKTQVDNKRFVFVAQSANPMRARTVHLTPGYNLKVSPDTVICDLPYYGRSYSAPMNPADAGIKFTSSETTYEVKERKKGGWDFNIKAKDGTRNYQIYLSITSRGSASARVISSDRESISYDGYLQKSP